MRLVFHNERMSSPNDREMFHRDAGYFAAYGLRRVTAGYRHSSSQGNGTPLVYLGLD